MVESVGPKPVQASDPRGAVTRIAATASSRPAATPVATPPITVAAQLAQTPPVDMERVKAIKTAIAEGRFPISPSRIADQLIALRYEWLSDDAA